MDKEDIVYIYIYNGSFLSDMISQGNYITDITVMNYTILVIYTTVSILREKAMAPNSSTLAWKIPWMAEPGRL